MRPMLHWAGADLRAGPARAVLIVAVSAGVIIALLLSAGLLEGASNPWQGLFTATRGAQIWLHLAPGTNVQTLPSQISGISGLAGPYPVTAASVVQGSQQARVELRGTGSLPGIGRPLMVAGRWLSGAHPRGVVLESTFAQAIHAKVGTTLVLQNVAEAGRFRVRVAGLAVTADQGFYPDQTPGLILVLPGLLQQIDPNPGHIEELVGLRIANPNAASFVVQQVVAQLGNSAVGSVSTWQQVRQSMARRDPLLGLLLALFGLMALGAAMLAIVNVTSGRVLLQTADLGMLKTLGFTPVQVVVMLTAEHAVLSGAGFLAGLLAARVLMPLLLGSVPGVSAAAATVPPGWAALIIGGALAAVVLATAAPAWQAGRVGPVAAVRTIPPRGHLSWLARLAMAAHLPPAIVLGAHSAFVRKLSAVLTIGALAITMLMITISLDFWSTLNEVQRNPAEIGLAASVTAAPGTMTLGQAGRLIRADPQVAAAYTCVQADALALGDTTTVTTLGMGTSARPYPFHVVEGRLYHAPEEAVATEGLMAALRLRLGQFVRMWIGGVPVTFHLVGRIIDPQYDGEVLAYGRDTLAAEGAASPVGFYSLVLRPGVDPARAAARLSRESGGRLNVAVVPDPAHQLGIVRIALDGLLAVLALIGVASLLTAAVVGQRDHQRDVGVLRAMGLTPVQVRVALLMRTTVLAVIAVAAGTTAGRLVGTALVSAVSQRYGLGAGIAATPSAPALALTVTAAVAVAALTAMVPARSAGQLPTAAVLGP